MDPQYAFRGHSSICFHHTGPRIGQALEMLNQTISASIDESLRPYKYVINTLLPHYSDVQTINQKLIWLHASLNYCKGSISLFYLFIISDSHQPITTSFMGTSWCTVVTDCLIIYTLVWPFGVKILYLAEVYHDASKNKWTRIYLIILFQHSRKLTCSELDPHTSECLDIKHRAR